MTSSNQVAIDVHIFGAYATWEPDGISYYMKKDATCPTGYIPVYSGQVIIGPPTVAELLAATIERLRKDQASVLADAQAKHTEIESTIQNLLALTYEEPVDVA